MAATQRFHETLQALQTRRRLLPIVCLCLPVCAFELFFSPHWHSALITLLMSLLLPLAAPLHWRLLFTQQNDHFELRMLLYILSGAIWVGLLGGAIPWCLGAGLSFITDPATLFVALLLYWVGGWTLGRDIDLELRLHRAIARAELMELQAEHAQLMAIRNHLDPHFLYNTLNAIAEWCQEDPAAAERGMLQLSHMLRVILEGIEQTTWPLAKELALTEALIALYHLRDPSRIQFENQPPPDTTQQWMLPPMMLLSLVENAIKHGPWSGHKGPIKLSYQKDEQHLCVILSNPSQDGPSQQSPSKREGGYGLPLLQRRLQLLYEGNASLKLKRVDGRTEATLRIPSRHKTP